MLFFLLFFHLGCFTLFSHRRRCRRDPTAVHFQPKLATFLHFIKRLFSSASKSTPPQPPLRHFTNTLSSSPAKLLTPLSMPIRHSPTAHHDIHPCTVCGEIFQSPALLELHHSTTHAVSDLVDGENIVRIIFKTGWPDKVRSPAIHRILKIHNHPKIVARFEDHRESVKSRAAASKTVRDERCIADGNELLRFYCTTFVCELDGSICSQQYCSLCGIIRGGFSPKMDGIPTLPTSYAAHLSVPEDVEEEFKFMHVKRALLVCRVIAGRVGCDMGLVDKEDPGFDSLAGRGNVNGDEEDELLVFSPRAVLPCFVILYTL